MENLEYKGYTIEIVQDEADFNPREDNLSTILCFHRRYSLGDKTTLKSDDFNGWEAVHNYLKKELKAVIILPLYLYDHSGISISVGSFIGRAQHAEWDSGQVGFVYIIKDKLKAEKLTKKRAEEVLRAEVKTYDQYLRGEVYRYSIEKAGQTFDGCGGYYDENDAISEAKSQIDYYAKEEKKLQLQY
jgi:hypothetical protein